jgi:uncharacterized protein (TIGR02996 family)
MRDGYTGYWCIELHETSINMTFGRIGGPGGSTRETQTKTFATPAKALAAHDKLVAEKLAKSHREVILPEPADPSQERVFVLNRMREQGGWENLFWTIAQEGKTLRFTEGDLPCTFPTKPAKPKKQKFADEAEAGRERQKQIAVKFTEGYREVTETPKPALLSPFAPPDLLRRRLVRDDGSSCEFHVQGLFVFFREGDGEAWSRWLHASPRDLMDRLVEKKKADGYREVEPTVVRPGPVQSSLEAAVEAAPDDPAPRKVYADWLTEQPDPILRARGELIQLQFALEDASLASGRRQELKSREVELLEQYGEALCGLFAHAASQAAFAIERGWVRSIAITDTDKRDVLDYSRLLREWPLARLLTDLNLPNNQPVPLLMGAAFIPHLRRFKLGEPDQGRGAGVELAPFLKDAVRLEQLEVFFTGLDMEALFAMPFPRLRELTVHGCEHQYPLEVLGANPALPRLEAVRFWPHFLRSHDSAYITASAACAFFRSPHLKSLRRVAIYQSELGDEGCAALVESGLLGQLEELDLDMGRISDEGARLLAGCPALPRLKRLVLTHNQLTEAGIEVLLATGVPLEAGNQFDADRIAGSEHLCGGDFE